MPRRWSALLFALAFPTLMAWLYFVVFAAADADRPNRAMQALYAGSKLIQFSFPLLWLVLVDRTSAKGWSLSLRGVGLGFAFGLVVALAIFPTYGLLLHWGVFDGTAEKLRARVGQLGLLSPTGFLTLGVFLSLLHSGMEEYYWRGFVHGQLREELPSTSAIVVSSLGFMSHHVILLGVYLPGHFWRVAVPLSLCIAVGGAFWAWLHERTGSLLGPWLGHALIDAAIMTVGYRLLFA